MSNVSLRPRRVADLGEPCADCSADGAIAIQGGDSLCIGCRIDRSNARLAESRLAMGIPAEEPIPVMADWAQCALNADDWRDPFED